MAWARQRSRYRGARERYMDEEVAILITIAEAEAEEQPRRGSVVGRTIVPRDRYSGHWRLLWDYFTDAPVYGDDTFRRRFRMCKAMFIDICHALEATEPYFQRRCDAAGLPGFTTLQKVTAAVRVLAYGGPADRFDEYIRMGESTILQCVQYFTRRVVDIYGPKYLRQPNDNDIARLLAKANQRGFPGMIGSIDCMHWEWENCPTAWQGQYRGHHKKPTLILEAVASYDLWIWHAFFGMPGSCNDINVLHRSPVFDNIASGVGPAITFQVNGTEYNMGYFLADGIYPPWATLVSGISSPQSNKHKYFTKKQQEYRKDVERAFGVLQAKYAIVKRPSRLWNSIDLKFIVDCVVALHNMGIDYERGMDELGVEDYEEATHPSLNPNRNVPEVVALINRHQMIRSRPAHEQLKVDLIEHVWNQFGSN